MKYFAALLMKQNKKRYSIFQMASSIFMMVTMLWLTISIPFVTASQQEIARQNLHEDVRSPLSANEEEAGNPLTNTDEKAPGTNNSLSEEYLHEYAVADHFFSMVAVCYALENADTYTAYHGELLVPPPNKS